MSINGRIGLGTVQFGMPYGITNKNGKTSGKEVSKILKTAILNGLEILDSASAYGDAEMVLGNNKISNFKVVSKFISPSVGESISLQFNHTLNNLKVERIYAYLAHRPMDIISIPSQWGELKKLKKEEKIVKIGFSLNEPRELEMLLNEGFIPDLIQVPYNYFDRRFEFLIKRLHDQGCEIHTRSSFLQGLFFANPDKLGIGFKAVIPILKSLQKHEDLNGALLNFVLEKPFIDTVIIGVENNSQLVANLSSLAAASSLPELKTNIPNDILMPSKWKT